MGKHVFGGLDQVRLKLTSSAAEFEFSKYMYYTIKEANSKGADQTLQMLRLICAFVVRI